MEKFVLVSCHGLCSSRSRVGLKLRCFVSLEKASCMSCVDRLTNRTTYRCNGSCAFVGEAPMVVSLMMYL